MRFFRSKIFWGLIVLAIAGGLTFYGIPYLNGQTRVTKVVVRVKAPISAETEITEDMLTTVEVGAYNSPNDAFTSVVTGTTTNSWSHPFSLSFPAISFDQSF